MQHLLDEQTALAWAEQVPDRLLTESMYVGTPDELVARLREYGRAGLTHPVLSNLAMPRTPKLAIAASRSFSRLLRDLKRI